ncbi:peptidase [Streptomyces albiflavescens]|uniref:Peptidase n=1 Tax=Streptomyces albiflavescens TaxID=1623582 RepID=A0A917YCH6_9ACTN|nr:M23 family metallopeptidase [Streptomyces albiflavescens]GGN83053.1 peptidase [Streptomyces albiflavescens]
MNDRHPSGTVTPPAPASDAASALYASYGGQEAQYGDFTAYDGYTATGYDAGATATGTGAYATASFETDPLFGDMSGNSTGSYDATQWNTGGHQTLNYDPYAAQHQAAYDTGSYATTTWAAGYQQLAEIPAQHPGPEASGQWDATAWLQPEQPLDGTRQWSIPAQDTGAYDATQWNAGVGHDAYQAYEHPQPDAYQQQHAQPESYEQHAQPESYEQHPQPESYEPQPEHFDQQATAGFEQVSYEQPAAAEDEFEFETADDSREEYETPLLDDMEEVIPAPRAASRSGSRSRRRSPAKRSALLTVAVPSACVMGVAGIAAASVGNIVGDDSKDTTASATDATSVKPSTANNKLDTQLQSLSAGADDFADRASRTQERIDLKAEQEAQKKKAAEEAARKERLRPKFAIPVTQKGLSAYFGQAGINWMSVHTGIDFPVSYGTTVMAATDGTVRTQWNSAYGNMAIVTAMDGTETWYCHLSSYKVASGTTVKAGDPIAFSGNSGNSTGPHLHFEVRPAGGSAIDPLPWLRSHGLDPT